MCIEHLTQETKHLVSNRRFLSMWSGNLLASSKSGKLCYRNLYDGRCPISLQLVETGLYSIKWGPLESRVISFLHKNSKDRRTAF
jgi:hypothetical protein